MSQKVSVILPVYNRSGSLEASCRSVLDQSYRNLELIVVDDASTDDLTPIIETLDDPRVMYVRHEQNAGAAAARNTGLAQATGDLIAFQDSDDLWLPGKLEKQVALLREQPEDVGVVAGGKILYGIDASGAYGAGRVTYSPKRDYVMTPEMDQVALSLTENRISLQNSLFRRDCYPGTDWFDPKARANNDWEFTIRLVQHTKINDDIEPVVVGFVSDDSISSSRRRKITGHLRLLKKNRHLREHYPTEYGRSRYVLGRGLVKIGKQRTGRKFMLQGIRECPEILPYLVRTGLLRVLTRLRTAAMIRPKLKMSKPGRRIHPPEP